MPLSSPRMHRFYWLVFGGLLWLGGAREAEAAPGAQTISWQPWNASVFAQAKREHKFVLLDLHAVWCHWCHVMDETTYADPRVIGLMQSRYIAVSVDADARPDLANRYEDYGWPATVVFNADGGEIVKRRGYLPPEQMASMLQAIIDDPSPGPSVTNAAGIDSRSDENAPAPETAALQKQWLAGYDFKLGGWGHEQKFLNWDNVEYALVLAQEGDAQARAMARQTLDAQLKLVDPVWGGVDQYSVGGDWNHPHYEKIMQMQAENLKIYARAYLWWKNPMDLRTAEGIHRYVRMFLTSPEGVVYTSQDADLVAGQPSDRYYALDDAGRRRLGIPQVDRHIYARENGWFIEALTVLYSATGDARYRDEAVRAAGWIVQNRSVPGGGFRHGDDVEGILYLGDTLAMGRAFLGLNQITGDHAWLDRAQGAADFIGEHFVFRVKGHAEGFATAANEPASVLFTPQPEFDENVSLARFANLLHHATGREADKQMVKDALRFCANPARVRAQLSSVGGLLLAERELALEPLHIAVVGKRDDPAAYSLFAAALATASDYRLVEWADPREGASTSGIAYPDLSRAAAYVCSGNACSSPAFDVAKLKILLDKAQAKHSEEAAHGAE